MYIVLALEFFVYDMYDMERPYKTSACVELHDLWPKSHNLMLAIGEVSFPGGLIGKGP